ncbi:MAG: hypothetical protein JST65_12675 [Acidobacteria bacterium]|nr:hypothetical protein [Acidobacteriota bacterium]
MSSPIFAGETLPRGIPSGLFLWCQIGLTPASVGHQLLSNGILQERFGSLQEVRENVEREHILRKLEEHKNNITRTAKTLGLERSNLYRKMRALGIAAKE